MGILRGSDHYQCSTQPGCTKRCTGFKTGAKIAGDLIQTNDESQVIADRKEEGSDEEGARQGTGIEDTGAVYRLDIKVINDLTVLERII